MAPMDGEKKIQISMQKKKKKKKKKNGERKPAKVMAKGIGFLSWKSWVLNPSLGDSFFPLPVSSSSSSFFPSSFSSFFSLPLPPSLLLFFFYSSPPKALPSFPPLICCHIYIYIYMYIYIIGSLTIQCYWNFFSIEKHLYSHFKFVDVFVHKSQKTF